MSLPLLTELRAALASATSSRRASILDQIAALFLTCAERYSAEQVGVFDEVFLVLIKGARSDTLAGISRKMAALENAPINTIAILARHDNIAVAAPILEKSPALTEAALIELADGNPKSLRALAGRAHVSEQLADILIDRGDANVLRKLVANTGACLSEIGFVKLINRAESDSILAKAIAARADLPPELKPFLNLAIQDEAS